ncbi:exonuclease domain-containing protein [Magnetovibrio blakemorei]|uniref:Exonuclease domain-containing protein n=1 Tax=Magnetovibrio blakemorei TaxID=28181 RepID=A0A1E5Q3H5_9PROT|nr:exonuclease domain-containing protein [Magnetovibrio blakemorei]OEJ63840.1 hypothetical protein BEN30_17210 [Magnetovibrio blakemorei]
MPTLGLPLDSHLRSWPHNGIIGILDLEYTAWQGSAQHKWSRPMEWREIVQIGFLLVDAGAQFQECGAVEFLVNPQFNPILSDYFVELTGITQDSLKKEGLKLSDTLKTLSNIGKSATSIIFNGSDGEVLRENCQLFDCKMPWNKQILFNFRPLLADTLQHNAESLVSSDLPRLARTHVEGRAHSALHDCRAIAAALSAWRQEGKL